MEGPRNVWRTTNATVGKSCAETANSCWQHDIGMADADSLSAQTLELSVRSGVPEPDADLSVVSSNSPPSHRFGKNSRCGSRAISTMRWPCDAELGIQRNADPVVPPSIAAAARAIELLRPADAGEAMAHDLQPEGALKV